VAGVVGAGIVLGAFRVLASAQSTETFSLTEMIGSTGRVSVTIPASRYGTVLISFAGASHNMTATADAEIAAGRVVKVVAIAGNNLVVEPTPVISTEGARTDA
jgi:membrane-bound ClpP family serine protease